MPEKPILPLRCLAAQQADWGQSDCGCFCWRHSSNVMTQRSLVNRKRKPRLACFPTQVNPSLRSAWGERSVRRLPRRVSEVVCSPAASTTLQCVVANTPPCVWGSEPEASGRGQRSAPRRRCRRPCPRPPSRRSRNRVPTIGRRKRTGRPLPANSFESGSENKCASPYIGGRSGKKGVGGKSLMGAMLCIPLTLLEHRNGAAGGRNYFAKLL